MARPLDDYKKKRDFSKTREPAAGPGRRAAGKPSFVIHRHEARRLHYDLRLEWDGVLRCWAVPKGFSYDPKEKRLAVQTEDHPLEYEAFSGHIPKGEYGAGTMTIWDRGTYDVVPEPPGGRKRRQQELKVILDGRRLRGEWHLVETKPKERSWLLFKARDRYAGADTDTAVGLDLADAREALLPRSSPRPMEPKDRAAEPFADPDWLFEMTFAGRRCFAEVRDGTGRLRGLDDAAAGTLDAVVADLGRLRAENALIDGVLVALDAQERPSTARLEALLAGKDDPAPGAGGLVFYAFDLLHYDRFDLRPLSLMDRKTALRSVLHQPPLKSVLYVDHVAVNGTDLVAAVEQAGLPGVIAKRMRSPYTSGHAEDWRAIPVAAEGRTDDRRAGTSKPLSETLAGRPAASHSRVKYSNLEKVFWPEEGYTKGDLIAWYEAVADVLLPYLRGRAVHMNRYPDGIHGKSFYQRKAKEHIPSWIHTEVLRSEPGEEPERFVICDDRDTILYLANLGSIDLHPWLSRLEALDNPDWMVLDLDAKDAPFPNVVRIAREAGKLLRGIGLRPSIKTSGASGMHIYVPLVPGYTYDQSRAFCEAVARCLYRDLSDIATVERNPKSRGQRVYLDFGQNRRSATVVPPYVPRPVVGATVSTPLFWDELDLEMRPSMFTIQTALERITRHGDLFQPTLTDPQDLLPAIEALGDQLRGS